MGVHVSQPTYNTKRMIRIPIRMILAGALLWTAGCPDLSGQAPIQIPGLLKFEAYPNITGAGVAQLTGDPTFPDSPSEVLYLSNFDTRRVYPSDSHENFGARISGFITPVESGEYEFFLRTDDAGELFMSPDADPANLEKIAEETGCCDAFHEPGAPETSSPRSLVAGQSYAIQVLYKEATGGDYAQVAWRKVGDATPAAQLSPIPGAFLSTLVSPGGNITITKQPVLPAIAENDMLTLSVEASVSGSPVVIQWQRNGVSVPGLTGGTVAYGPVKKVDNGASFRALISIPGAFTVSSEATLVVGDDVTRPTIKSLLGSDKFNALTIEFSEALDEATAVEAANYQLSGGLQVGGVVLLKPNVVRLDTTQQTPDTGYTLTLDRVSDTAGNRVAAGTTATFSSFRRISGGLKFESYRDIGGGTAVNDLLNNAKYPDQPDEIAYVTQFTSRQIYVDANAINNYGGRISGWLVPKESADYEFFIRSDDGGQLSLSTDEDPANAVIIASESSCCGPFEEPGAPETSGPIRLEAGTRYYIEALWKEGGGGDYCDVAWRKVGDPGAARILPYISGEVLETYAAPGTFTPPSVQIVSPANNSAFTQGSPVTLTATATAASGKTITKVEFFEQGQKLGQADVSPFSISLTDLRADSHSIIARATDSAGLATDSAAINLIVGERVVRVVELLIDQNTTWRYDRSGQDLGTDWRQPGFDDSAWPEGTALIADESTTTVAPIRTPISRFNDEGQYVVTFYFRTKFNFTATSTARAKIRLRHVVDDGVIFYLNGERVYGFGLPEGEVAANFSGTTGHENAFEGPFDIPLDQLAIGENVLAAEVHQAGTGSSDMVFGAELIITVPEADVVTAARLTVGLSGGTLRVSWTPAGGTLESASVITGPWTPIANATSPYSAPASAAAQYFRVRQ